MLSVIIAQQLYGGTSFDIVTNNGIKNYVVRYPFDKYKTRYNKLTVGTYKKWLITKYLKEDYGIVNTKVVNKVTKEFIKLTNKRRREILGLIKNN